MGAVPVNSSSTSRPRSPVSSALAADKSILVVSVSCEPIIRLDTCSALGRYGMKATSLMNESSGLALRASDSARNHCLVLLGVRVAIALAIRPAIVIFVVPAVDRLGCSTRARKRQAHGCGMRDPPSGVTRRNSSAQGSTPDEIDGRLVRPVDDRRRRRISSDELLHR